MDLKQVISSGDVTAIAAVMQQYHLKLEGDKLVPSDEEGKAECKKQYQYYDRLQLIKKILLNS